MEIVDPRVTIITETDPLRRIERCGRVCYRSEGKIGPDTAPAAHPQMRYLATALVKQMEARRHGWIP